jgi:hypothetical protein
MFALAGHVVEPPMPEKAGWQGEMPFLTLVEPWRPHGRTSLKKN